MKRFTIVAILLLACGIAMAKFTVVERTDRQLIVDFSLDEYSVQDEQGFSSIMMSEAGYPQQPGQPSLPELEFKIGIPPNGDATFSLISSTQTRLILPSRLIPVPHISHQDGRSDYEYMVDEELYRTADRNSIQKLEPGLFRGHAFVPFVLSPFRYDGDKTLDIVTSARLKITLQGNIDAKSPLRNDPMSASVLQQLLNPEDAQSWYSTQRTQVNFADFSRSPWWMKLETDKAGMYRINPSQLTGFPVSEIDPRSFRIFSTFGKVLPLGSNSASYAGEEFTEVPIQVIGAEDGSFDSADYLLFYGSDRTGYDINGVLKDIMYPELLKIHHNPYSHNAVYWLTFAGDFEQPPLRIPLEAELQNTSTEVDYHRQVLHVEEERHRRDQQGFTWFMSRMFGSSTLDYAFELNLVDLDPSESQLLELRIQQESVYTELTHKISVFVNGVIIPSSNSDTNIHTWSINKMLNFRQESSAFQNGNNRIVIRVHRPNTPDNLFLDLYRVTYSRKLIKTNQQYLTNAYLSTSGEGVRYEFSGSATGVQVFKKSSPSAISQLPFTEIAGGFTFASTGGPSTQFIISRANEYFSPISFQKLNPVDLSQVSEPIQSVIVTGPEFLDQANLLAEMYRQNWGYHTKVVLQQDIMNQFNGGHPDPGAIRQYLKYIYFNAPAPALHGLTLLGLGTIDWRNYSGVAQNKNKTMVYQDPNFPFFAGSDDFFAMLTNDRHPDIVVGRYPVSNTGELTNMLSNFQNYSQNPTPGLWRNQAVLLADDTVNGPYTNDWQHTRDMQRLSALLNPSLLQTKIFAYQYDFDEFLNKPKVRDALIEEINSGKLLWYYVGHGSFDILGMQDYFNVATDLGRLHNRDTLPLFIAASCGVSTFDHWSFESLGQKIVMMNNAGAIASVGASRDSYPGPNHSLMSYFVPNMLNRYLPVGEALIDAKLRYTGAGTNDDVYVLLGDPYLHITPPLRAEALALENLSSEITTLHPRQEAKLSGSFGTPGLQGKAQLLAYDSSRGLMLYTSPVDSTYITQRGPQIFRGSVSVEDSDLSAAFFVPDDIVTGNTGLVLSYLWDEASSQDYVTYYHPLPLSSEILPDSGQNESAPEISIFLNSYDFREGDTVGTSPLLYAKISDDNGINLTSSAGHNILLVIDNSLNPISVTQYFEYDTDSHTQGTLTYQMPQLSEGSHRVQIIAFDNQNLPQVAEVHFVAKKSGAMSLENLLIYPNPIKNEGHITFIISEPADITLDVFTMSGKRIRRIKSLASPGFNQIAFDGKDEFGARLANNTYFIRVRAKTSAGKSIEKRERLVIYK